jgi:hypothetical protein
VKGKKTNEPKHEKFCLSKNKKKKTSTYGWKKAAKR